MCLAGADEKSYRSFISSAEDLAECSAEKKAPKVFSFQANGEANEVSDTSTMGSFS